MFFLHFYCPSFVVIWVRRLFGEKKCARGKSNCHTDFETFHSHFQWALFLNAHGWNLNSPPRITWNNLNGYRPFVLSTDDLQWPNVTKFYYMTMTWKHITYDSIVENQHFLLCHQHWILIHSVLSILKRLNKCYSCWKWNAHQLNIWFINILRNRHG